MFDRYYGHSKIIVLSIGILQRACVLHTIYGQMNCEYLFADLAAGQKYKFILKLFDKIT
ncbi:hypothetical protein [Chamaesiphon polymorphus]|uniref:hypothetical protein n=1 Tax=Chamaesiphon polymorphus TaxID=2107691 RepID=UPI0015E76D05|nr:hypothetical protein [Chamaesiphon polymorphus]